MKRDFLVNWLSQQTQSTLSSCGVKCTIVRIDSCIQNLALHH